ncbi:MAG: S8 family serine peptidase [Gaiellaceae bacterium]
MQRRRWLAGSVLVALALVLAGSSGAAREPAKGPRAERVPGELVVVFRPGVAPVRRERALAAAGLRPKRELTRDGRNVLAVGEPRASEVALKRLGSDSSVAYAEPNFVVRALATPNDPSFGQLWGLVNTGQTVDGAAGTPDADVDADAAWDVSTGSVGVAVGVIDTGVDFSHPDLAGTSWINPGENCSGCRTNGVDDDGNGFVDDWRGWDFVNEDNNPFDDHGHGTHVAGTIAAVGNNGVGIAGVNWTGRVAALKFLDWFGSGTTADAIRALDYATQNGIRITNNSWGGAEASQALLDAIERAGAAGGLVVAAAGNDGVDADVTPMYPAAFPSPAIVSAAATDSRDGLASFSNRGRTSVDLGAPGVSIYSTLPGGGYDWWSGTSMATPHVAGTAALAKAAFPQASSMGIKALLLRSVDAEASLAETTTGGRLNAGGAVGCSGAPQAWLEAPLAGFQAIPGEPVQVVALGAACGDAAAATVTATANGTEFTLTNRGDGFYSGTFVPAATGSLTIAVTATAGSVTDTRSVTGTVAENYVFGDDAYAWVDATAGGTNTGLRADDASVTVVLPFAFPFFDGSYTSVKISTNGYLVLGPSAASAWSNVRLPSSAEPNGIVAPLWDDLRLETRGSIWYRTLGTAPNRRFVVSWIGAPHYYDVGDSTFQAILEETSGDIVFQYQDVSFGDSFFDYGASATVGIEDAAGAVGRTFSVDQASLASYEGATALRLSYRAGPTEPDLTPPAAPSALTATAGVESVSLDWADNIESDLASYRVYRDGVQVVTTTASAYADGGLQAGVTYRYHVTAVDRSGNESAPSGQASAIPRAAPIVETFAPDSFSIVAGSLTGGSLASLASDDGNRLEVSGRPAAEVVVAQTLPAGTVETMTRLWIDFDGHVGTGREKLTLSVFDWVAGSWRTLSGPAGGPTADLRLSFELADPTRYASASGQIRFAVRAEHKKGGTARVDLVSFTVEH